MAESLKAKLAHIAEDFDTDPNVNSRLQRQINLLAEEITRLMNPRRKKGS
ncbi:hypothetical protein LCGC14_0876440 [marine sediment metagenome]|uniref:Uncharacterized protein n=1 Tax=marine sediment metagenome TaxID=412755 RepID=A0A0F9I2K4_9ZZZZ